MLTILIPEFFNALDQVFENVQEDTYEEEEDDTEARSACEKEEGDEKKQQEQHPMLNLNLWTLINKIPVVRM